MPIWKKEDITLAQNFLEKRRVFQKTRITWKGVGRKSSLSSFMAASCHKTNQNKIDKK